MKNRQQALRKAAILIASLDRQTAERMLAQFTEEQTEALAQTVRTIGEIDPAERRAVIEEFFRLGPLVPEKSPPGLDLDGPVAEQLAVRAAAREADAVSSGDYASRENGRYDARRPHGVPFRCLEEASSAALARYLEREHPQIIAVVVSHLPSQRAAELLGLLPAALQGEVSLRLAHLEETDPEFLAEIEHGLQAWLAMQPRELQSPAAGLNILKGILAAADQRAKGAILRNLAQRDRRLAGKLADLPRQLSFAEVEQLDDASLATVLHEAPGEVVLLALAGARQPLVQRVLRLVPMADARRLRHGLDHLGPTRLSDVERAQHELGEIAGRLAPAGKRGEESKRLSVAA